MRGPAPQRICSALLLLLAGSATLRGQEPPATGYAAGIEVVARSLYFDLLDAQGKPVQDVPLDALVLTESGVPRTILEVRRRAELSPERVANLRHSADEPAKVADATPPQRFVLVALDPSTLGRSAWSRSIEQLSAAAEALTRIGPVDVTVLTTPPLHLASAATDPVVVRRALDRARREVTPLDEFYLGRNHFVRDLERIFDMRRERTSTAPGDTGPSAPERDLNVDVLLQAEFAARELIVEEERLLDLAVARLQEETTRLGRPLVAVWAAQGDPDTPGFIGPLLPSWVEAADRLRFQGTALGTAPSFETRWKELADDGVTLVCWSQAPDSLLEGASTSLRHSSRSRPSQVLGGQSLTLFGIAAERTGGALVQSEAELREAAVQVGGRHELVYQSDDGAEGWRQILLTTNHPGWSVRAAPRIYVRSVARSPETASAPPPSRLWTELSATVGPGPKPGRDTVTLSLLVDLAGLRERVGVGAALQFQISVRATPPDGRTMAREVALPLASLPGEGNLRYQLVLDVPAGTSDFAFDVREKSTGAVGRSGPIAALTGTLEAQNASPPASAPSRFAESTDVRLGEARFVGRDAAPPRAADLRVTWKHHEQTVLRVAGGPESSLEIGFVLDASESVRREREAFAQAAATAAQRLLRPTDRVFRVDFAGTPSFLGAARGGPAALFARIPPSPLDKTAILDGIRFALDRFAEHADRTALVVFTDGCDTGSRTSVEAVTDAARRRAIPVFVVLADDWLCQKEILAWDQKKGDATRAGLFLQKEISAWDVRKGDAMKYEPFVAAANSQAGSTRVSRTRRALATLAESTGAASFPLGMASDAGPVWQQVESALARLWVAIFEATGPEVDSREVAVLNSAGEVLRPAD